jgi:hypothetical protein
MTLNIRWRPPNIQGNHLAHYHGQIWNASEFARAFGVAATTIRHYLDVLTVALARLLEDVSRIAQGASKHSVHV